MEKKSKHFFTFDSTVALVNYFSSSSDWKGKKKRNMKPPDFRKHKRPKDTGMCMDVNSHTHPNVQQCPYYLNSFPKDYLKKKMNNTESQKKGGLNKKQNKQQANTKQRYRKKKEKQKQR